MVTGICPSPNHDNIESETRNVKLTYIIYNLYNVFGKVVYYVLTYYTTLSYSYKDQFTQC